MLSPDEKFACLEVDYPWYFDHAGTRLNASYKGSQRKYKIYDPLPLDEGCELLKQFRPNIADHAMLFMWCPWSMLLDWNLKKGKLPTVAYPIDALGFEPRAAVTWIKGRLEIVWQDKKNKVGPEINPVYHAAGGNYTFGATEVLVICIKGKARTNCVQEYGLVNIIFGGADRDKKDKEIHDIMIAGARGKEAKHSKKPATAKELIERLCKGPRLEIFARSEREGWTCWGDQMPSSIEIGSTWVYRNKKVKVKKISPDGKKIKLAISSPKRDEVVVRFDRFIKYAERL